MAFINIRDSNFVGDDSVCHGFTPTNVEWYRGSDAVSSVCFFTDMHLPEAVRSDKFKRKIAWLLEPRSIHPRIYQYVLQHWREFDVVLTFDDMLISSIPNARFYPWGTSWIEDDPGVKSKLTSTIVSPKRFTMGHRLRHEVAKQFSDKIDVWGRDYLGKIPKKELGLAPYYFSVTIENDVIDTYFTEKLLDCFATKTVPIYRGTHKLDTFFNTDGIIFFDTIEDLKNILDNLTIDYYNRRISAVEENYKLFEFYRIPEDWLISTYPDIFQND